MAFRAWMCVVAMVSWGVLGAACGDSGGEEGETVEQALTPAGVGAIQLCGTKKGVDCNEGTYCRHHDGVCGDSSIGWCAPVSDICTMQYAPVCGCDGQTYGNECVMMGAAVSMAHDGACADGCASDADCGVGEACDVAGCGDDVPGQCVKVPMHCNRLWAPVCGCDGDTFSNDCHRVQAGVALAHKGPCAAPCGGIVGAICAAGELCFHEPGACDIADAMGVCEAPPKKCPKTTDPVCGCDGQSYRNECMMKLEGVSMDHEGPCCKSILCLVGESIDTDGDGCGDVCPPADGCEGPNPAGCKNTGCDDGETCTFGVECTPSICFCDSQTGLWACTKDCGGGTCVSDEADLCADFVQPGCVQSGCADGFVCDQSVGCVPSACGCDPETGAVMCTADCGGGTCVPEEDPTDLCADYVPPGCVQSGCADGFVCDQSVGCVPSVCNCDPESGMAMCTMDCGGGTCVPEDTNDACEEPSPQACKVGDCADGFSCDLTIGCSPSNCNCFTDADGVGHWNCTKDCKPGLCVPDELGAGCCVVDDHCDVSELCVNGGSGSVGVCKVLPPPAFPAVTCWSDQGCPDGEVCDGGSVCPCQAQCIVPDSWGTCVAEGGEEGGGPGEPDAPPEEQ